ncbi:uncharacterized protein LOC113941032 [Corapipo altera]|uniref:uncharacterized protein LOC113941032 n=1 Tax=Corapipo altera TaxID=415028 RepID=UPI000FD647B5|nr:uncharacterized protein LOC113941032 [Corapipo altera]
MQDPAGIQPSSQPALRKDFIFVRLHLAARGTGEEAIPSPGAAQSPVPGPTSASSHFLIYFFFFSSFPNSTSTQWRLPIRSRRGCHATYVGARLAQPTFIGAMPKRKPPVPLRARGALRAGSGRAALPPQRRRRRRRECSALRPAAGSVHCSSAGPSPESEGSGSQRGHPAPTPLNTAGQLSPRRKEHGGAARPVFHRPGDAATGAIKTKRRTATFHTLRAPSNAAGYGSSASRDEKHGGGVLKEESPPSTPAAPRLMPAPGAPQRCPAHLTARRAALYFPPLATGEGRAGRGAAIGGGQRRGAAIGCGGGQWCALYPGSRRLRSYLNPAR